MRSRPGPAERRHQQITFQRDPWEKWRRDSASKADLQSFLSIKWQPAQACTDSAHIGVYLHISINSFVIINSAQRRTRQHSHAPTSRSSSNRLASELLLFQEKGTSSSSSLSGERRDPLEPHREVLHSQRQQQDAGHTLPPKACKQPLSVAAKDGLDDGQSRGFGLGRSS